MPSSVVRPVAPPPSARDAAGGPRAETFFRGPRWRRSRSGGQTALPCTGLARRAVLVAVLGTAPGWALAQGPPRPPEPPRSARAAAPVDLTGYWVSVITEDWRWRMVTPLKGDFASVPVNAEGRKIGEAWDPARDEAAGLQCRAYGAAAIMRMPLRVHITWQDDNTLKLDTDAGHADAAVPVRRDGAVRRARHLAGVLGRQLGASAAGRRGRQRARDLRPEDRHARPRRWR